MDRLADYGLVSANEAGAEVAIPSSSRSALSYGVIDDTTGPDDVLESVMSWRLEVTHHTGCGTAHRWLSLFNEARMTPADSAGQLLITMS